MKLTCKMKILSRKHGSKTVIRKPKSKLNPFGIRKIYTWFCVSVGGSRLSYGIRNNRDSDTTKVETASRQFRFYGARDDSNKKFEGSLGCV